MYRRAPTLRLACVATSLSQVVAATKGIPTQPRLLLDGLAILIGQARGLGGAESGLLSELSFFGALRLVAPDSLRWHRGDGEALWWPVSRTPIASIARVNAAYPAGLLWHCFEGRNGRAVILISLKDSCARH